jgi:hypothetical protein
MRRFIGIASAAALIATSFVLARPAVATDEEVDVGGGAAAVSTGAWAFTPTGYYAGLPYNFYSVDASEPAVAMGTQGGESYSSLASQDLGVVSFDAAQVGVHGNRTGTPYAQAWAHVEKATLRVPGAPELTFNSLNADCNWTKDGGASAVASVQQGTLENSTVNPAPNTTVEYPGVGSVTFNEQQLHAQTLWTSTGYRTFDLISVAAVHIHLLDSTFDPYFGQDARGGDIYLALASCDPTRLPPISGIGLANVGYGSGGYAGGAS